MDGVTKKGTVYKISYTTDERGTLLLHVLGRHEDGTKLDRRLTDTRPYFYVPREEAHKAQGLHQVVAVEDGPPSVTGRETARVYTRYPFEVPIVKGEFTWTAEADIVYSNRTRVDHDLVHVELPAQGNPISAHRVKPLSIPPAVTPRRLPLDIEVDDSRGYGKPKDAPFPVLSVAFYDSFKNAYGVIYSGPTPPPTIEDIQRELEVANLPRIAAPIRLFPVANERVLMGTFANLLGQVDPDIVSAWNGYEYDFPYLGTRAERLSQEKADSAIYSLHQSFDEHASRQHSRFTQMDPMVALRKQELKQESYKLEVVAQKVLGYGKVFRAESVASIRRRSVEKFLAYNLNDVRLIVEIEKVKRLTEYFLSISEEARCELADVHENSKVADTTLLYESRITGVVEAVWPSRRQGDPKAFADAKAAEVFDAIPGIHIAVGALDLGQEYPSVDETWNISPDSQIRPGMPVPPDAIHVPDGNIYRRSPLGLIPRALERLRSTRNAIKAQAKKFPKGSREREQMEAVSAGRKAQINSVPGNLGSPNWRMPDKSYFEDITRLSRKQLNWNRNHIEDPTWLNAALGIHGLTAKVIHGHTDSCHTIFFDAEGKGIEDSALVWEYVKKLQAALNASYPEFVRQNGGGDTNYTSVEAEGVYGVFVLPTRKGSEEAGKTRYYGRWDFYQGVDLREQPLETRLKYSAIEVKKFNQPEEMKDVQRGIIERVLRRDSATSIVSFIDAEEAAVLQGERDEKLLIPVKRSASKANQPQIRAVDAWESLSGHVAQEGDSFHWTIFDGLVVAPNGRTYEGMGNGSRTSKEFAFPIEFSLEELRKLGWKLDIDRYAMMKKTVLDAAELVYPGTFGETHSLEGGWA